MRLFRGQMRFQERLVGFFGCFARQAIDHPVRVLLMAAAVTLAAAPGIARLKLRTDGHALVSPTAPEVIYDQVIRDRFGIEDPIIVVVRSPDREGIFNPATVQLVRDLTADFAKLAGLSPGSVMSLATEPSYRLRPGTLLRQTLLEPPLRTKAELDQLREDLRKIERYTGTFVSTDGKSAAILIGAPAGADRTRLYQKIREVIAARGPLAEEVQVTGAPVAAALLGIHILEDLRVAPTFRPPVKSDASAAQRTCPSVSSWRQQHGQATHFQGAAKGRAGFCPPALLNRRMLRSDAVSRRADYGETIR